MSTGPFERAAQAFPGLYAWRATFPGIGPWLGVGEGVAFPPWDVALVVLHLYLLGVHKGEQRDG